MNHERLNHVLNIKMVLDSKHLCTVFFILKLILSRCYDFWLLEVLMNGDARTPSGTGLLLTPEGPELDIP